MLFLQLLLHLMELLFLSVTKFKCFVTEDGIITSSSDLLSSNVEYSITDSEEGKLIFFKDLVYAKA